MNTTSPAFTLSLSSTSSSCKRLSATSSRVITKSNNPLMPIRSNKGLVVLQERRVTNTNLYPQTPSSASSLCISLGYLAESMLSSSASSIILKASLNLHPRLLNLITMVAKGFKHTFLLIPRIFLTFSLTRSQSIFVSANVPSRSNIIIFSFMVY